MGELLEFPATLLRSLCQVLHLALGACDSRHGNADKLEAIRVFQRVANRILNSGDLDKIFTKITKECLDIVSEGLRLVHRGKVGGAIFRRRVSQCLEP